MPYDNPDRKRLTVRDLEAHPDEPCWRVVSHGRRSGRDIVYDDVVLERHLREYLKRVPAYRIGKVQLSCLGTVKETIENDLWRPARDSVRLKSILGVACLDEFA